MSRLVTRAERDGVVVLTADRPPVNAMDVQLLDEVVAAVEELAAAPPAAVVVAGRPGSFSAGLDLKAVPGYGPEQRRGLVDAHECVRLGAFDEAVAPDAVIDRSVEVARELAQLPADVYARTKAELRSATLAALRSAAEADPLLSDWA